MSEFYEDFWRDGRYQYEYALDSAARDRYPAIKAVWQDLKKPRRVLDFGCGNGVLSYWLKANGFADEVVGTDISETALRFARNHFERDGLRFHVWPLEGDIKFDAIISSHVLEHLPEPEQSLCTLLPLAEWFVIEVPLERCLSQALIWRLRGKPRHENALGHLHFWTKAQFNALLRRNGLVVVRDHQYASAPFSKFNGPLKRFVERALLRALGVRLYGLLMATHYIVLARRQVD